jgi:predicted component of type VI protein secretion system
VLTPVVPYARTGPFAIDRPACIIGTSANADLRLESPLISRRHALIVADRGEAYVRDLGSRNGVYLNGTLIREARLSAGDLLRIGLIEFHCDVPPAARQFDPIEFDYEALSDTVTDAPGRAARMVLIDGASAGASGPVLARAFLEGRTLLIGAREGCDLQLPESVASAVGSAAAIYAVIFRRERRHFLLDLSTGAGGGEPRRLRNGDEISIGEARLRYELGERPDDVSLLDAQSTAGGGDGGGSSSSAHRLPRAPKPQDFQSTDSSQSMADASLGERLDELMAGDIPRSTGLSSRFGAPSPGDVSGPSLPPEVEAIPSATEAELLGPDFVAPDGDAPSTQFNQPDPD